MSKDKPTPLLARKHILFSITSTSLNVLLSPRSFKKSFLSQAAVSETFSAASNTTLIILSTVPSKVLLFV